MWETDTHALTHTSTHTHTHAHMQGGRQAVGEREGETHTHTHTHAHTHTQRERERERARERDLLSYPCIPYNVESELPGKLPPREPELLILLHRTLGVALNSSTLPLRKAEVGTLRSIVVCTKTSGLP
jgi:hypothetical protein